MRPARLLGGVVATLAALPPLIAPTALNIVNLSILRPNLVAPALVETAMSVARSFAWGPFVARVANTEAGLAQQQGDSAAQLALLSDAAAAAPWDPAVAARLAELRLATGDREGAIRAWQSNRVLDSIPLNRGIAVRSISPAVALDWFAAAQAVDPSDPRPYLETARVLLSSGQPDRAAAFMAQALRLSGRDPTLGILARRLLDPFATLDVPRTVPPTTQGPLLLQASQVFAARGDFLAAIYADQIALQADPSNPGFRADLANLRQRVGGG